MLPYLWSQQFLYSSYLANQKPILQTEASRSAKYPVTQNAPIARPITTKLNNQLEATSAASNREAIEPFPISAHSSKASNHACPDAYSSATHKAHLDDVFDFLMLMQKHQNEFFEDA
jgi:hypothetical protein